MSERPSIIIDAQQVAALVEEQIGKLACTLRPDYLAALEGAVATETSERGRDVLEQLIANAHLAEREGLPLCQDTGYTWVCLEVSRNVLVPADVFSGVDAAVARASAAGGLRMSLLFDALIDRTNTGNNTPAFCEVLVRSEEASRDGCPAQPEQPAQPAQPSQSAQPAQPSQPAQPDSPVAILHIMLKGGGSDNASSLGMLPPSAGVEGVLDFVVKAVAAKGANACPPLVLGVGVGSTFDKVAGHAKHALLRPLGTTHPEKEVAALESELLARINALGIGPGGLGGSTTAFAVHIESAPSHITALPIAVCFGCNSLRTISIPLFG